jgi:tRNA(Arg) A34 adenosine deaminase TadA
MSKFHKKCIDKAANAAEKSNGYYRHGAVIVYRNKVISSASNMYLSRYTIEKPHNSIHAEVNAIMRVKNKHILKHCFLYVVRINNNGEIKNSKPCENCMKIINKHKIKLCYHS